MGFQASQRDVGGDQAALHVLLWFSAAYVNNPPCEQPSARTYDFFIRALYPLEAFPVFVQLITKVLMALKRLFLLCLDRLLLCKLAIVVDRSRECC